MSKRSREALAAVWDYHQARSTRNLKAEAEAGHNIVLESESDFGNDLKLYGKPFAIGSRVISTVDCIFGDKLLGTVEEHYDVNGWHRYLVRFDSLPKYAQPCKHSVLKDYQAGAIFAAAQS